MEAPLNQRTSTSISGLRLRSLRRDEQTRCGSWVPLRRRRGWGLKCFRRVTENGRRDALRYIHGRASAGSRFNTIIGEVAQCGRQDPLRYLWRKSASHGFAAVSDAVLVGASAWAAGFVHFGNHAGFQQSARGGKGDGVCPFRRDDAVVNLGRKSREVFLRSAFKQDAIHGHLRLRAAR